MTKLQPFHLAFPVHDIEEARKFYCGVLGCNEGRSDKNWVDFDFFGHQVVAHLDREKANAGVRNHQLVDDHKVPVPHFGLIMEMTPWKSLRDKLLNANIDFIIEPYIRFEGEPGEQATMFFADPSGNALEFKAFKNMENIFAKS